MGRSLTAVCTLRVVAAGTELTGVEFRGWGAMTVSSGKDKSMGWVVFIGDDFFSG